MEFPWESIYNSADVIITFVSAFSKGLASLYFIEILSGGSSEFCFSKATFLMNDKMLRKRKLKTRLHQVTFQSLSGELFWLVVFTHFCSIGLQI
jgi:hypothetical protein